MTAFVVTFVLSACSAEVHHGLDERSANEVIVTLTAQGIPARKISDSPADGPWTVVVPRAASQRAIGVVAEAGLPRQTDDLNALLGDPGLVPSSDDEHARRAAYLEGSLATTLQALDGVLDARVHAAIPPVSSSPLNPRPAASPRVSVLLVQRAGATGPPDDAVRAIVMGSVDDLSSDRIAIVRSQVALPAVPEVELVAVGPLVVSAESAPMLRAIVLVGAGVCGLLAIVVVVLVVRFRESES